MDRVLDRLWLGSARDFQAPLRSLGFSAALDLRDGIAHVADEGVVVHRVKNRDGDPWDPKQVSDALDFIAAQVRRGRVLVGCAACMSRSVSMVIGYLVRVGMDEAGAFELVRRARPEAAPVSKMLDSVLAAARLP